MIDYEADIPVYQQIANLLRARIEAGEWAPRRRLPSVTHLEQEYGVARKTVMRALEELANLGLIYTVKNRGSFVRGGVEVVELGLGARAIARPATDAERAELDLDDDGWVVVVERPGKDPDVYPADRVELRGPKA